MKCFACEKLRDDFVQVGEYPICRTCHDRFLGDKPGKMFFDGTGLHIEGLP